MKFNSKNIIVPALAIIAGAGLVGSVSGTVAWYQYSTRATAAYVGTSASTSRNLQIKVGASGEYKTDLTNKDIASYLTSASNNDKLSPVTTGKNSKDDSSLSLKGQPVYQYEDLKDFKAAAATDTVVLPFTLKLANPNGDKIANEKIYLADLEILDGNAAQSGKADMSSALRVHFSSTTSKLFAKGANATAKTVSTVTHGKLDLNGDGLDDKVSGIIYDEDHDTRSDCDYGAKLNGVDIDSDPTDSTEENFQDAYNSLYAGYYVDDTASTLVAGTDNYVLGVTDQNGELAVTVTIFLEGWQSINAKNAWEDNTIGSEFKVGMRFVCNA